MSVGVSKGVDRERRTTPRANRARGKGAWLRLSLLIAVTALVNIPIIGVVILSLRATQGAGLLGFTFANFEQVLRETDVLIWLKNSLGVTLLTVLIALLVAAPGGYVVSRVKNRLVLGYSLALFVIQSLPVITAVIPLFMLFAQFGLVDSLGGLTILYVGATLSVATWMMASYYDSIPVSLEESAWMDGCSLFGGFIRIVLRNSLPGVLSTAIFCFLLSWNDYLIALVFIRSSEVYTLQIGLSTFFQQNATAWGPVMAVAVVMMLPPVVLFAFLNKYFSVGGIGGALGGR